MNFYENKLKTIWERIENARVSSESINLVAVSKSVEWDAVKAMYEAGQMDFGENRVQVLKPKVQNLSELDINWHFIGRLQTNKINNLIDLNPILWHSCDSLEHALEFDKRLEKKGKTLDTLLQINSANEDEKQGVTAEKAKDVYQEISEKCKNLNLKGVMSIGAFSDDKKLIQKSFEQTHKIYESLPNASLCSMGMSSDFELAIKCGSNMLRIGSVLFH